MRTYFNTNMLCIHQVWFFYTDAEFCPEHTLRVFYVPRALWRSSNKRRWLWMWLEVLFLLSAHTRAHASDESPQVPLHAEDFWLRSNKIKQAKVNIFKKNIGTERMSSCWILESCWLQGDGIRTWTLWWCKRWCCRRCMLDSRWTWRSPACWWGPRAGAVWLWCVCTPCTRPAWAHGPPFGHTCWKSGDLISEAWSCGLVHSETIDSSWINTAAVHFPLIRLFLLLACTEAHIWSCWGFLGVCLWAFLCMGIWVCVCMYTCRSSASSSDASRLLYASLTFRSACWTRPQTREWSFSASSSLLWLSTAAPGAQACETQEEL